MAKKRKKKKKGGGGIIVLLIAGVVAAGYFMRDCLPNWGLGGGGGSGSESAEAESEKTDSETKGEKGTVSVLIKGEQCAIGEATAACADTCESIKKDNPADKSNVEIDSTAGAHQVVEDFKKCLTDAGYTVNVKSQ